MTTDMTSLDAIRKIFPDWPSEFDVAKQSLNWVTLAQDYYCAALILDDEIEKTHQYLHEHSGIQITDEIAIRFHGRNPSLFCFAFAVELAIKAAYIQSIARHNMQPNKKLPFANHNILNLADEILEIKLTAEERQIILQSGQIILNGKYPTLNSPSDTKEPMALPNFQGFRNMAEPIYRKYVSFVVNRQKEP